MSNILLYHYISLYKTGSIDKSTWGDVDYTPFVEGIWRKVAIHAHHQQRCENYVQMAALIAKTLVGEARRTWRAIAVSTIIRRFNLWALDKVRSEEKDLEKRKKIKRVSGSKRLGARKRTSVEGSIPYRSH